MIGSNYLHAVLILIIQHNYNQLYNNSNQNGSIIIKSKYFLIFLINIQLFIRLFNEFNRLIFMMNKILLCSQIIVKLFRYLD